MALSLGIAVGDKIQVGQATLSVLEIQSGGNVSIDVDGKKHHVCGLERTEIAPDVFVCYGEAHRDGKPHAGNRLAFEAPKDVRIRRCS